MPRSGEEARRRLQQAALDLYREQGYDETTTAQIAARAGVTERTYFRHFADKREVLFDGENDLREWLDAAFVDIPADVPALVQVQAAFRAIVPNLERNRPLSEPRSLVIAANAALRERALTKDASLVDHLAWALRARGLDDARARLGAEVGLATVGFAMRAWLGHPDAGLLRHLDDAFATLTTLTHDDETPART